MKTILILLIFYFISSSLCDVYMHNPRGSNNRACETGNRQTERFFDSQNNNAGGYTCPRGKARTGAQQNIPMYYYEGSKLEIEWTNQHSCGDPNNECQVVLQYMCDDVSPGLRDGYPTANNNAGTNEISSQTKDDPSYGSHEEYSWYQKCQTRKRNRNLFTADQINDINGNLPSTRTRQNNNGNRRGFECPEERDYYPYWAPTPWKDIAILTTNVSRCGFYKKESQNVADRGECYSKDGATFQSHNNENECILNGGMWKTTKAWGLKEPDCLATPHSRDNHLGNADSKKPGDIPKPPRYTWTIPKTEIGKKCILRLRYNITTGDTPWNYDVSKNKMIINDRVLLKGDFGYVQDVDLELNTNQYGRCFQDRSYVFEIKKIPDGHECKGKPIYNLNVRGKRGNIVQAYPSVEYDFIPNELTVKGGDCVHFQWTGSDYNNANNAGQGLAGTDRSNLIQTSSRNLNVPRKMSEITMFLKKDGKPDTALIQKFAMLEQTGCATTEEVNNGGNRNNNAQNCGRLNRALSPYFDAGLVVMRASGKFSFISTRNNNFSNRSHKGSLVVVGGQYDASMRQKISIVLLVVVALFYLF